MERVSFEIERQDVADALQAEAQAHGRTVEAELAALVERTYAPSHGRDVPTPIADDWVDELIKLADGADLRVPEWRGSERIAPDYPAGMEPLPGESFIDHITRTSRPGIELDTDRDPTPHDGPRP